MSEVKIVAKVEGKEITEEDVLHFLNEIGPEVAMQFQSEEGIKKIVEEMVNQELLLLDAKANEFHKEEEFRTVMDKTEENLLKSYAFQKVIGDETVTEDEINSYFETFKGHFAKDSADASHILVDTEEEAKNILEEIKGGLEFGEAAMKYSNCPSKENGGRLGEFQRGMMVPEFEEEAFTMEIGTISEPVKTQFGYHIIQLNNRNSSDEVKLESVYEDVKMEALRIKQQNAYVAKLEDLKSKYNTEVL
ncbi:MAG: peptidylprolyl isomerase [Tissierellia bacterium]|nr:peptidylprolyl isomerase [Tissierellia bacterium]